MGLLKSLSELPEEKANALENILNHGTGHFNIHQIAEIIESYDIFWGNANLTSKKLGYAPQTILKYWKLAGFEIRKKGWRGADSKEYKQVYAKYKELIEKKLNRQQIADELGITKQGVSFYLKKHPELATTIVKCKRGKPVNQKKYLQIKELIEQILDLSEIANRLSYSSDTSLRSYLYSHPELMNLYKNVRKQKRRERYNNVKELIEKGLNQSEIANGAGFPYQCQVSHYLKEHQELKERYWEIRRQKK